MNQTTPDRRALFAGSWKLAVLSILNIAVSIGGAVLVFPHWQSFFPAGVAIVSVLLVVLRFGWAIPCMIAGIYIGLFLGESGFGYHNAEERVLATIRCSVTGAAMGLGVGYYLDRIRYK